MHHFQFQMLSVYLGHMLSFLCHLLTQMWIQPHVHLFVMLSML